MSDAPFPKPICELPADPIYGLQDAFRQNERTDKLNLAIGVVPDPINRHQPYLFPAVRNAIIDTLQDTTFNLSYLPLSGEASLVRGVRSLLQLPEGSSNSFGSIGIQTIGGTGSLSTIGKLFFNHGITEIVYGSPTWPNHRHIFSSIKFTCHEWQWLYDNTQDSRINTHAFEEVLSALKKEKGQTKGKEILFLFHLVCHNPTGIDPTKEEWEDILTLIKTTFPESHILFDCAYFGFHPDGDESTLYPLQLATRLELHHAIAFSCSKTLGLYSERVGVAFYIGNQEWLPSIRSHMISIQRSIFSSASKIGAIAAGKVLDPKSPYHLEWKNDLKRIAINLHTIRKNLSSEAERESIDLGLVARGQGLFALLPISHETVRQLREKEAIFLTDDGRVNVCALQNEEDRRRLLKCLYSR